MYSTKKKASLADKTYLSFLNKLIKKGKFRNGSQFLIGEQLRFDLQQGFPLLTTKKMFTKSIIHELLWMLSGETNTAYLKENGVTIWDQFADTDGEVGPMYGHQWRSWTGLDGKTYDQIKEVVHCLLTKPNSRDMVVSTWNVSDLSKMAIHPTQVAFQLHVVEGKLCCNVYQRSADAFNGIPANIITYSLLTMMLAQVTNLKPGELIWTGGDVHVYVNDIELAKTQLTRSPYAAPIMNINPEVKNIFSFTYNDFKLEDYEHHPAIKNDSPVFID